MSPKRRLSRSAAVLVAALATVVGATAVTLTATPSAAAANCNNGYVALTYDDGPNAGPTTSLINALTANGVRATFFNIGQKAQQNQALVRAQQQAGRN